MLRYEEEMITLMRMILEQLRRNNENLEELNQQLSRTEYLIERDEK